MMSSNKPYRTDYRKNPGKGNRKNNGRNYGGTKKGKYQKAVFTRMRGAGFADTLFVQLNYVESLNLSNGSPRIQYTFRGNSLFDPDYTGTGHQPMYFDQYAAIYQRYRVLGSSIRVDCINAQGLSACYFIMFPNTEIATLTSIPLALEQSRARAANIMPIAGGGPAARYQQYCSTRKACGLTKGEFYDDTYSSTVGNNPNQIWYWNLFWETTDSSSDVTVNAIVKLVYYVQFYDKAPGVLS